MMKYECDRCHEQYLAPLRKVDIGCTNGESGNPIAIFDLCHNCVDELRKFMKGKT